MSLLRTSALLVIAGLLVVFAGTRSVTSRPSAAAVAAACPPGYASAEAQARAQTRERRGEVNGLRARTVESESPPVGCVRRSAPERAGDLLTMQAESGRRERGGQPGVKSGAYAAAVRDAADLPSVGDPWQPVGTGPLVADSPDYPQVNGEGLGELNGRVADFTYDATHDRLYAAVGEGGVWESTDRGASWHSIGDALPTQAVGGIAYSNDTLVIATGDNVFGGGGTFAGLGAFRSTDRGAHWTHADGIPSGIIAFKVAADTAHPGVFYAATGAGLFRSSDGGASFVNVALPTGECAGQPARGRCALANMVTDVVVQGPANAK